MRYIHSIIKLVIRNSHFDLYYLYSSTRAENILLDSIDYTDRNEVMAAALFYQYLSEKDSEFLKNNNYTKEEVMSGFKQLLIWCMRHRERLF